MRRLFRSVSSFTVPLSFFLFRSLSIAEPALIFSVLLREVLFGSCDAFGLLDDGRLIIVRGLHTVNRQEMSDQL
jgi:hypothetical protein